MINLHFLEQEQHRRNISINNLRQQPSKAAQLRALLAERLEARKALNSIRLEREKSLQPDFTINPVGGWPRLGD